MFLDYLRSTGSLTASVEPNQDPPLLVAFRQWMSQQRGTCDGTLYNYGLIIRALLARLGEDPRRFDAQSLRQFVLETSRQSGWAAAKSVPRLFACFFAFSSLKGKCADGLEAAIPVLAHWRLSSLPRYLLPEDVERVIASCDLDTPVGRRDRAILLLLARLGLRAGDIVQLRLERYRLERSHCPGMWKGTSSDTAAADPGGWRCRRGLPQGGRPQTDTDVVFLRARAPFRAFAIPHRRVDHCCSGDAQSRRRLPESRCGPRAPPFRGNRHVAARSIASGDCGRPSPPLHRNDADLRKGRRDCSATDCSTLAGGAAMLAHAVESYLSVRRACGFDLKSPRQSLAKFCRLLRGERQRACVLSNRHRVGRIGAIGPPARPPPRPRDSIRPVCPCRGSTPRGAASGLWQRDSTARPTPYIFSPDDIVRLVASGGSVQSSFSAHRPTARSSPCSHARDCACPRPSACALRTSPRMAWSSGVPSSGKVASCPCTKPRGLDSNGISNTASPTPPSITTYSFRCEESRCFVENVERAFRLPSTGSAYGEDEASTHAPLITPHLRCKSPGSLA